MLKNIANELEKRAASDIRYGWSTNQVKPMMELSKNIFEHLAKGKSDTDPSLLKVIKNKMIQFHKEKRLVQQKGPKKNRKGVSI